MKYIVDKLTKEHRVLREGCIFDHNHWDVVEADDEGWIAWVPQIDSECPLNSDTVVTVWIRCGDKTTGLSDCFIWHLIGKTPGPEDIIAYHPILPTDSKPDIEKMLDDCAERFVAEVESKPTLENTWAEIESNSKVDVFTRLASAVAASDSIPALIAEINAMLPDRFEIVEKAKPEAVHAEDMSDREGVNGFRVGGFVKCIDSDDSYGMLKKGAIYKIVGIKSGELVLHSNSCSWMTSRFMEAK